MRATYYNYGRIYIYIYFIFDISVSDQQKRGYVLNSYYFMNILSLRIDRYFLLKYNIQENYKISQKIIEK
jgi:hypothetical protein